MYLLEDGTSLTQEVKNAFKRGLTRAYIKLGNTIISPDNYLINAKYKDEKADPETGQFIGVTSMRELTIKLYNYENTLELENQEVEYFVGALVGNEYKYINFGKFIVQKPDNEEVNEETTFTALDYMSKFDGEDKYTPQITFGTNTTLYDLAEDVCRQAGVELGSAYFRNSNMQVLANPFQNGENCRTVLKSIAKVAFSPAYIGQDNKLYIGFDITNSIAEIITTDDFFENKPNDEVKPITALTLRSSEVKTAGQTIYASQELIDEYGINELIIEEDYLAYTDTLRNAYLTGATLLFGLTYKPLTIDLLGSIYLSFNDVIKVINLQSNEYITYALNNTHEFNGTLYNTISAPALTEAEEKYKYESEDKTHRTKTAIEIDKANGEIRAIVADVNEQREITTRLNVRVGELESAITEIADITKPGMTDTAHIPAAQLTGINASEPITIKVHPIVQNISYLYPMSTLYPNSTLYLKTRTLRFYNSRTNENFDCILPCDLFYYDAEHYDDISYEYGDGTPSTRTCIVNKKVGINANGTTYLLNTQTTIPYPYPTIPLTNGDYLVSLVEYEAGYIYVLLMAANIYTTQYATRIEMNSAITQTAQEIDLSVNQRLSSYSTTTEMNSAINLKANEITNSVSATYATNQTLEAKLELKIDKDDNDQIVSMINQSADIITLNAGRIIINSTYFNLSQDGRIIATRGTIGNWSLTDGYLFSEHIQNSIKYQSGLTSKENFSIFLYAGADVTSGSIPLVNSNLYITNDGLIHARWFEVNGERGYFYVKYNNGNNAMIFSKDGISRYLSNTNRWTFEGIGYNNDSPSSHSLFLYDAPTYSIVDALHTTTLMSMIKTDAVSQNAITYYWTDISVWGTRQIDGINNSIYIQGYQVLTSASDERLKENIKDSKDNALQKINNIKIRSFDWRTDKHLQQGGEHVNNGYIAQEVQRVDETLVNYNEEFDTYQMNELNLNALQTKAIQELYKKIEELEERIK